MGYPTEQMGARPDTAHRSGGRSAPVRLIPVSSRRESAVLRSPERGRPVTAPTSTPPRKNMPCKAPIVPTPGPIVPPPPTPGAIIKSGTGAVTVSTRDSPIPMRMAPAAGTLEKDLGGTGGLGRCPRVSGPHRRRSPAQVLSHAVPGRKSNSRVRCAARTSRRSTASASAQANSATEYGPRSPQASSAGSRSAVTAMRWPSTVMDVSSCSTVRRRRP